MPNTNILIITAALALAATISLVECFTIDLHNGLLDPNGRGYMVPLSVGLSKTPVTALFSTDIDLTTTQCTRSRRDIPCSDRRCQSFSEKNCTAGSRSCPYDITTGDGTVSKGSLSAETLGLGYKSGSVVLGCGDARLSPVAGFGRGPLSILAQLNVNAFTYCLSSGKKGKLGWGQDAGVLPGGVVLPLVQDSKNPQFLFVDVASVGVHRSPVALRSRRMLISTGTTLTKLPSNENTVLNQVVRNYIKAKNSKLKPSNDLLDTCYNVGGNVVPSYFPDIELKSSNGKVVVVPKESAFVAADPQHMCLAVTEATGDPILGSLWQRDFKVGISTAANTVTFKYTSSSSSSSCV